MALISSESMTLMVKGTLQSEFLTMFWPTRLTYSTMTGSVTMWADFSISMEYCLPMRISESVEYQLPTPRPPMLRVPTALTSSSLPGLMWGSSASPGDGRESDLVSAFACCLEASLSSFLVALGSAVVGLSATGASEETWAVGVVGSAVVALGVGG